MQKKVNVTLRDGREIELKVVDVDSMMGCMSLGTDVEQSRKIVSISSGLSDAQIGKLDYRDYLKLQKAVIGLITLDESEEIDSKKK